MGRPKSDSPTKRQKRKKDANRPKRSTSAYFYFLAHCREKAQKEGRSLSKIAEFTKECSAKWKVLTDPEKKPFDKKAAEDKARYDKEMTKYKGGAKDPNKPKRPQSAYFLFLADFRVRMKNSGIDHKELLRKAGEEWRKMSDDNKKPYEKKSLEEQKKYEEAMANYRKGGGGPPAKKAREDTNGADDDDEEEEEEEDEEEEEEDEEDDDE